MLGGNPTEPLESGPQLHPTMDTSLLSFPYPVITPLAARDDRKGQQAPFFLLQPPYTSLLAIRSAADLEEGHLTPGSIAGVRTTAMTQWSELQPIIIDLRQRLPAAPLVITTAGAAGHQLLWSGRAYHAGVRAIFPEGQEMQPVLRAALTCPDLLADDVVDWLLMRRVRLTPAIASLLKEIFLRAREVPDLTTLLADANLAESSARFRLHKRLLPTPSRWFQLARAVHTVLRLQAEPEKPLLKIAHDFGYADHSALSQLVYRAFRVRPGAVRGTVGWEWLMHRWINSMPDISRSLRAP